MMQYVQQRQRAFLCSDRRRLPVSSHRSAAGTATGISRAVHIMSDVALSHVISLAWACPCQAVTVQLLMCPSQCVGMSEGQRGEGAEQWQGTYGLTSPWMSRGAACFFSAVVRALETELQVHFWA